MGKLTDIILSTAGIVEILTYRENQPNAFDRALEKCARLYHAGVGMYRIFVPEPPEEHVRPYEHKPDGKTAEHYKKKIADLSSRGKV